MYIRENSPRKLKQIHDYRLYESALSLFSKARSQRTDQEREILISFLSGMPVMKQALSHFANCKDVLVKCAEKFEYRTYAPGAPIMYRGQKCEELIVILKGSVNIYDAKPSEEVTKQHNLWEKMLKPVVTILKKARSKAQLRSPEPKENMDVIHIKKIRSENEEDGDARASTVLLPSRKYPDPNENVSSVRTVTFNDQIKVENHQDCSESPEKQNSARKSVRLHLKRSPGKLVRNSSSQVLVPAQNDQKQFNHLPEEEKLLLKDPEVKKRYIQEGASLLSRKGVMNAGDIINSECFKQEYRSQCTLISATDTETITMSREVFRELFKAEHELFQERTEYLAEFFNASKQVSMATLVNFIVEKTYILNDKIYDQDDQANGLYFIKSGEVKCCASISTDQRENNKDSGNDKGNNHLTTYLPSRKEVVGAQWLQRDKAKRNRSEEASGSKVVKSASKAVVGTLGQGNSFGEEGLVTTNKRRAHAAFAATANVHVYFLGSQYYSTIQLLFPKFVQILVEKAKTKNDWLEKRMEDVKEVKTTFEEMYKETSSKDLAATLKYYRPPPAPAKENQSSDLVKMARSSVSGMNLRKTMNFPDIGMQPEELKKFSRNTNDEKNYIEGCIRRRNRTKSPEGSKRSEKSQENQTQGSFQEKLPSMNSISSRGVTDASTLFMTARSEPKKERKRVQIDNNAKSSYIQALFTEIGRKAQDFQKNSILPELEDMHGGSFTDKFDSLIKKSFVGTDEKPSINVLHTHHTHNTNQTNTTASPVNIHVASRTSLDHEHDATKRNIPSIPKLRTILKRNQSVSTHTAFSARLNISHTYNDSSEEREETVSKEILYTEKSQYQSQYQSNKSQKGQKGSVTERHRSVSITRVKGTPQMVLNGSKMRTLNVKTDKPYLLTFKYKLQAPMRVKKGGSKAVLA